MNISFVVAKNYESGDVVCKQPIVAFFATNGCQCRFRTHHLPTFKMARKTSGGHATSYIKARTFFLLFCGNKTMIFATYYRKKGFSV